MSNPEDTLPAPMPEGHQPSATQAPTLLPSAAGSTDPLATITAPDRPPPTVGSAAPPGYEIERELGRGGMGVVYLARQQSLNRSVALKMILAGAHADRSEHARFAAEAESIAQIEHPNIVRVHEVGQHDGQPYFTLEFCSGGGLDKKLAGQPLAPGEAAGLAETLARAVHAAHVRGIVHRDLKPQNVLLSSDGTPKVTDFGLAKRTGSTSDLTATGAVMGTPSYMAPEQAAGRGKEVGPGADVYALGAMLYEFLTGRPPFRAATALDTVMQVIHDDPVPPTRLAPNTPRDLETICLKCLHKDPARRYATAEALADDLRRWRGGEPITARPVGSVERAVKWARRRPTLAGTLTVAVLAAAILTGAGLWFTIRLRHERDYARDQEQLALAATAAEEQRARELADSLAETRRERDEKEKARRAETALKEEAIENEKATRVATLALLGLMTENAARSGGKALDIPTLLTTARKQLETQPGQDLRARMTLLEMVGVLHTTFGRHGEAIPLLAEDAALRRKLLGESHRETLIATGNLAMAYLQGGEPLKGLALLEDVVRRKESILGRTDLSTLASQQMLVRVYLSARQFEKSLKVCEEVIAAIRQARGPDAGEAVPFLELAVNACSGLKQLDREESYAREVVRVETATYGRVDPQTAGAMARFGLLLLAREKWEKAETVLRDCLAVREELARRDSNYPRWLVANTRSMLGGALLGRKKLPEAGPLIVTGAEGLLAVKENIPPNGRRNLHDAIDRAVRYFTETGDTTVADAWRAKRVTLPPDTPGRIPPAAP